ncbi:hypothetical protein HNQ71_005154 [Mesorhizobium sangaii]|uniref:Uncharacterized protein n=1 Tax=Mesorhizobium sangaii TaxID=505389 RepID=A0A841PAZ2_9HYPH|nr:hypothetical protein [Mesorhizobium sangaii]
MNFDARRPPTPFAYEKIDLNVSVGNVPNVSWYKTDISSDDARLRHSSENPPANNKARLPPSVGLGPAGGAKA